MLPVLVWLWRLMRRRSAGARTGVRGQHAGSTRAALVSDLALWRARISRAHGFCRLPAHSCNDAHASTELARPHTTSLAGIVSAVQTWAGWRCGRWHAVHAARAPANALVRLIRSL